MKISQVHKLSRASQLSLLAVVILLGAIFFTVNSALQEQNSAGHASTTTYSTISIRSHTSQSNGGGSQINLSKPSTVVAGDVLLAEVAVHLSNISITPPSGWTLIRKDSAPANLEVAIYKRVATGVEGSSFTWSFPSAQYASGGIVDLENVDTSNPIDATSSQMNYLMAPMIAPSVTTTTPADELLFFGGVVDQATVTAPSGMTSVWTSSTAKTTAYLANKLLSASGSTGSKTGTSSLSGSSNIADLVALRPRATIVASTPVPTIKPTTIVPTAAPTTQSTSESGNILQNGSFENGKTPWTLSVTSPAAGAFNISTNYFYDGDASAVVNTTTSNSNSWYVQLRQGNVFLQAGRTYSVSFWAKAATSRSIENVIQQSASPYTTYADKSYSITTSWQRYAYTFVAPVTNENALIAFNLAKSTGMVWIDNVELEGGSAPLPTITPTKAPTAVPTLKATPTSCPPPAECLQDGVNICMMPVNGWCGFGTPTPVPVTPTLQPSPTCAPPPECFQDGVMICTLPVGGWCNYGTPTPQSQPTDTPVPGDTVLALNIGLHGIGTGGDSANPNSDGNMNPLHPARTVAVDIYDTQNQLVMSQQGTVNFDSASGKFLGTVDLGSNFATGLYTVKVKTDQYLRALIPGIQTITSGQTTTLPQVTLVAGDINGDNQINIVDYNILIGCYSDLLPATDCNATNNVLSDITDDGHVNQFDYNLFLRELTNIGGQ